MSIISVNNVIARPKAEAISPSHDLTRPPPLFFDNEKRAEFSRITAFPMQPSHSLYAANVRSNNVASNADAAIAGALMFVGIIGLGILIGGTGGLAVVALGIMACGSMEKIGNPVDKDGDGFIDKQFGGDDCDDSDKNIHPGVTEICNGKDDNCDGNTDTEHRSYSGPAGTEGMGICKPKIQQCRNGVFVTTQEEMLPKTEVCNNHLDDNCNNKIDEGCLMVERVSVGSSVLQDSVLLYPSIGADGRLVAFRTSVASLVPRDTNRALDIFVHDRQTGKTERVSVNSEGAQGYGDSDSPSISVDGSLVVFASKAYNLVQGDTNNMTDVFVHDRLTGKTERLSVDSSDVQGNGWSAFPSISADGYLVAFHSSATNLVTEGTSNKTDIFVRDRPGKKTERVSSGPNDVDGDGNSVTPSISADGQFVVFRSSATNLVTDDTNNMDDIFVYDRQKKQTERVSISSNGVQADSDSYSSSISADGQFVAFDSNAINLVLEDTNNVFDIFIHDRDRQKRRTERVSVDSSGMQGDGDSRLPSISADGRFVAFDSNATNLVQWDTNNKTDVFVHDRLTGKTERLSVDSSGAQRENGGFFSSISTDGRFVAFTVSEGTNGQMDIFVVGLEYFFGPLQ